MRDLTLSLPDGRSLKDICAFLADLEKEYDFDQLTFDCGNRLFVTPFSMAVVAQAISKKRKIHKDQRFSIKNHKIHTYAAHMGFFQAFGVDFGNKPGDANGGKRYTPLRELNRDDVLAHGSRYDHMGDLIQKHSDSVTAVLLQAASGDIFDTFSYSLREIIRNVFEHSECNNLFYCAQYWPSEGTVEVAVADAGIGIRQGLQTNPRFRTQTDRDAIHLSMCPGISGRAHLNDPSDAWANSGYGLYMTSRLCRHGGNFVAMSGDACVYIRGDRKVEHPTNFRGTAIRLTMQLHKLGPLQARLAEFREEAKTVATQMQVEPGSPSAVSMLVRRDFKIV